MPGYEIERDAIAITMDFLCLLYPTNKLNCSWSFDKLNEDARLSVSIRYWNVQAAWRASVKRNKFFLAGDV